jgi:hypothetical protein
LLTISVATIIFLSPLSHSLKAERQKRYEQKNKMAGRGIREQHEE